MRFPGQLNQLAIRWKSTTRGLVDSRRDIDITVGTQWLEILDSKFGFGRQLIPVERACHKAIDPQDKY